MTEDAPYQLPQWLWDAAFEVERSATSDIQKWLGPAHELCWRLNMRLQGRDPGQSIHWKGLS